MTHVQSNKIPIRDSGFRVSKTGVNLYKMQRSKQGEQAKSESTKKREGYWEFSQFCLGLVLFIRIFRELMHWEDIRFSFLVSLSLSFREKGA